MTRAELALSIALFGALALGRSVAAWPLEDQESAAEARAILAPIAERMRGVRFLRARFVQTQESLLLEEPLVTRGRLYLRAEPWTVLLEVEGPRPAQVRSDATSHRVYRPTERRAERWVFTHNTVAAALLACLGADTDALEKVFAVRGSTVESRGPGQTRRIAVQLAPTDPRVAESIDWLELVVAPDPCAVVGVRFANPDGERVVLELSDLEPDPADWLDPDRTFDAPLPDDVEVRTQRVPNAGAR